MESHVTKNLIERAGHYLYMFSKFTILSVSVGVVVGAVSTLFIHALLFVTDFRISNPWIIWFLPFAGILIIFLYHSTNTKDPRGTNLIIEAVRSEDRVPAKMAPLIFISTILTHLFGGSAGREGAALQLGGSLGQLIGDFCNINEEKKHILVMCGMSAAFSAMFGTPVASTIFSLELARIGVMYYSALVPCTISSIIAFVISESSGIAPERFHIHELPFSAMTAVKVIILAVLCAGLSILFCYILHNSNHIAKRFIPNQYLRVSFGGLLIILMVHIFDSHDYLGAGIDIIDGALEGSVIPEAFFLKLLFTSVTLGCGFKGGEIIPALFVGATFGCAVSVLIGLDPSLAAGIGMMAVFCGVTNCPITSLFLAFELFGFVSPSMFLLGIAISYMLSGYYSLYSSQHIVHSKTQPIVINRNAN